ncbi:helix-turn-helix domain-containing protein [Acinetobacter baumannii]|uniref:helix-turn-helix domain-containing protein n=1 Tax=Acinetobacter baumannii TaxID=470 RepID=UPI001F50E228|nr:helix-turn-helix domain-containing protein [Acinetobacter baumannii]MDH2661892.1 helix-turn-helix domain-containing protein [Acinetobacter baumannii]UNI12399.1 helix-turn-helix domain-containing protein [Acinetobacter baumannii]
MQNLYSELVKHFGTQELAAQAIGVKQSTINGYLKGKWNMSEKVAIRTQKVTEGKFKAADLCPSLRELEEINLSKN